MRNPYFILGLPITASDEMVKSAYLAMVRKHPPDQDPTGFQEIRQAFEAVRTRQDRAQTALFGAPDPDWEGLFAQLLQGDAPGRPSLAQFQEALSTTLTNYRLEPPGSKPAGKD